MAQVAEGVCLATRIADNLPQHLGIVAGSNRKMEVGCVGEVALVEWMPESAPEVEEPTGSLAEAYVLETRELSEMAGNMTEMAALARGRARLLSAMEVQYLMDVNMETVMCC